MKRKPRTKKSYAVDVFAKSWVATTVYVKAGSQTEAEKIALMLTRADLGAYEWRDAGEDDLEAEDIDHAVASYNEGEDDDPQTIAHAHDGIEIKP